MKKIIKKHKILTTAAIILILTIAGYFYFSRGSGPSFATITVQRGNIFQEVSATGHVKPSQNVDLAFQNSGKVAKIYAAVGDKITNGQSLIQLDNSDIYSQLAGAEADLKTQQAKLDSLKAGTRPEQIKISQTKVDNAEVALSQAKNGLVDKLQNAYTVSDDAIHNKADSFFAVPAIPAPQLNFSIGNIQLKVDIESQRLILENILKLWQTSSSQLTTNSDLELCISYARQNLSAISSFLDKANLALNNLAAGATISQTTIDGWKTSISTARANINSSISDISTAETALKTAESNLSLAQEQLNLDLAGATAQDIEAQEAQVEKAQANVLDYQAQFNKTIIRSPINGIVTKQDAKIGEIVSANQIIISIISANQFEVDSNVPEADIAKIKIGDAAKITLDAYGDTVVFDAKVTKIDPAETIIEGVATYKTTFQFSQKDARIKSGMTANIDISTDKRENVLVIPQRAVITRGTDKFVLVDNGTPNPDERQIQTGLRGSDGNVEIVSGLVEGERIAAVGSQ